MRILLLGPDRPDMVSFLRSHGDEVVRTEEKITAACDMVQNIDLIVSYGYRHIIKNDVIRTFDGKIVNLHISLLPWNRGADPNLWSVLEDTPSGVTIHLINEGVDTGDVIAQKEVSFEEGDTLATSYGRLKEEIERLFQSMWPQVRSGSVTAQPQIGTGTTHKIKDKKPYMHLLTQGWDTPVSELRARALAEPVTEDV